MELHYDITEADYIAFNMNYIHNNPQLQRKMLQTRIVTALLCLVGGTILMIGLKIINIWTVAAYVALAALFFFGAPKYMEASIKKNVRRVLKSAANKHICGPKTLTLAEKDFSLKGEEEDTTYQYDTVQHVEADDTHYFVFVGEMSALIVPFSAFSGEEQKKEFYERLTALPAMAKSDTPINSVDK